MNAVPIHLRTSTDPVDPCYYPARPQPKIDVIGTLNSADPPIFWDDLRAGYAVVTVENPQGEHVTFRVSAPRDSDHSLTFERTAVIRFVSVFTGQDNTKPSAYTYVGLLDEQIGIRFTQGSRLSPDNVKVKVAKWAIMLIRANRPPPQGYRIRASGICLRCGRLLTNPESLTDKYGPECIKRI